MDTKNSLDFKNYRYTQYNVTGPKPYDYTKNGILTKSMPKILFSGNVVLTSFLQLLDMRMIMLFKYIDKLKHFKHITFYK